LFRTLTNPRAGWREAKLGVLEMGIRAAQV